MGFALIASAVVIGVAIAMAVEIFTADVFPAVETINTAYENLRNRMETQDNANIDITSIVRYNHHEIYYDYAITISNTGDIPLPTDKMTVLFDGTSQPYTASVTYLYPLSTGTLTVVNIAGSGTKRIKVVTENAVSAYDTYP